MRYKKNKQTPSIHLALTDIYLTGLMLIITMSLQFAHGLFPTVQTILNINNLNFKVGSTSLKLQSFIINNSVRSVFSDIETR
jgi:hypothetical protein